MGRAVSWASPDGAARLAALGDDALIEELFVALTFGDPGAAALTAEVVRRGLADVAATRARARTRAERRRCGD